MATLAAEALCGFTDNPERSQTLDRTWYFDPAIYERERTAIFHKTWQYVGHVSMLAKSGDFIVRDILDQSVVVLRDTKGRVRAFFNVCQHRAHRLLEGEGRVGGVITCPYHGWAYGTDGALRNARGSDKLDAFDPDAFSLEPVRLDSFLGFLFVNLDGSAPAFAEVSGALAREVGAFSPDAANLKCAHRSEYVLNANWKNSIENYSECFHCPNQHKSLVENALDYGSYRITTHEHHHSHHSTGVGQAQGYSTATEGAAKPDEFGSWLLWPNWCIEAYPGGNLTVFHHMPAGPEKTVQRCEWYFPHETPTADEMEVIDFVHRVRLEDIPLCQSVQQGLHSLGYRQGRFIVDEARSEISEHAVHDFQSKVLAALRAGRI